MSSVVMDDGGVREIASVYWLAPSYSPAIGSKRLGLFTLAGASHTLHIRQIVVTATNLFEIIPHGVGISAGGDALEVISHWFHTPTGFQATFCIDDAGMHNQSFLTECLMMTNQDKRECFLLAKVDEGTRILIASGLLGLDRERDIINGHCPSISIPFSLRAGIAEWLDSTFIWYDGAGHSENGKDTMCDDNEPLGP